jgi:hypothetical protein
MYYLGVASLQQHFMGSVSFTIKRTTHCGTRWRLEMHILRNALVLRSDFVQPYLILLLRTRTQTTLFAMAQKLCFILITREYYMRAHTV